MAERDDPLRRELGIGRRELMRRAAIAGGLVWTAPVIRSLVPEPASAHEVGTPTFTCCYCNPVRDNRGLMPGSCIEPAPTTQDECVNACIKFGYPAANAAWHSGPNPIRCDAIKGCAAH